MYVTGVKMNNSTLLYQNQYANFKTDQRGLVTQDLC